MSIGNATPYLGYDSYIGVAEESTYGTYVTATSFTEFTSEGFKKEQEETKLPAVNNSRDYTRRIKGNLTVSGSIEAPLNVAEDAIVKMLKQAMGGTVTSSLIGVGCYKHIITIGDMESNAATTTAYKKGLSFAVRKGNSNVWGVRGGRVNNTTIKAEVGNVVSTAFEVMAKGMTITADSLTASFASSDPLNFDNVTIQLGNTTTSMTTEYFQSFEFAIGNNLAEMRALGSRMIHALPPVKRDVSCKLTQQFDTITSYNRFVQNTTTLCYILIDSGITLGAAAGNTTLSMKIDMPTCYLNNVMPVVGSPDPLTQEIALTAIRNTSTSYSVQITVCNATSSY